MKLGSAEDRNAAFAAMTPTARRKAVARDVLAQLRRRKYIATTGVYVEPQNGDWRAGESVLAAEMSVLAPDARCECCAKGAAFVSAVRLFDGACGQSRFSLQCEIWGIECADLMESCFEELKAGTPRQRLEGIMEAVIRHPQGLFTEAANRHLAKALKQHRGRRWLLRPRPAAEDGLL